MIIASGQTTVSIQKRYPVALVTSDDVRSRSNAFVLRLAGCRLTRSPNMRDALNSVVTHENSSEPVNLLVVDELSTTRSA